jgi:hypothetical protein
MFFAKVKTSMIRKLLRQAGTTMTIGSAVERGVGVDGDVVGGHQETAIGRLRPHWSRFHRRW